MMMATSVSSSVSTRESDADEYLRRHKILELFDNLTSMLVYHQPSDPKKFSANVLVALRQAKSMASSTTMTTGADALFKLCPILFDESNIEALFHMLDPEGKGYITSVQYEQAMMGLGVPKLLQLSPAETQGDEFDPIVSKEIFMKLAKEGLAKAASTFL